MTEAVSDTRLMRSLRRIRGSIMRPTGSAEVDNENKENIQGDAEFAPEQPSPRKNWTAGGVLSALSLNHNRSFRRSRSLSPVKSVVEPPEAPKTQANFAPIRQQTGESTVSEVNTDSVTDESKTDEADEVLSANTAELGSSATSQVMPLHVSNLSKKITEQELFSLFSAVAPILSVKICCNSSTGESLGYGYVNLANKESLSKVLDVMNYSTIAGQEIIIMPSVRDKNARSQIGANVFISGLPNLYTSKMLADKFSDFELWSCKVDSIKRQGFVHFRNKPDAYKAVNLINSGNVLDARTYATIHIAKEDRLHLPTLKSPRSPPIMGVLPVLPNHVPTIFGGLAGHTWPVENSTLFIKDLPPHTEPEDLQALLLPFGKIKVSTLRPALKFKSKWALVVFSSKSEALRALSKLNSMRYKGRSLSAEFAVPESEKLFGEITTQFEQTTTKQIMVTNLRKNNGKARLFNFCRQHGKVVSVKVFPALSDGIFKESYYGHIQMSTDEATAKVAKSLPTLGARAYVVNMPDMPNTDPTSFFRNSASYTSCLNTAQLAVLNEFRIFFEYTSVTENREAHHRYKAGELIRQLAQEDKAIRTLSTGDKQRVIARIIDIMFEDWDYQELYHLAVECSSPECRLGVKLREQISAIYENMT